MEVEQESAIRQAVTDAIKFVKEWRWDDRDFRIPSGPFGAQLAHSIDILLENAEYE